MMRNKLLFIKHFDTLLHRVFFLKLNDSNPVATDIGEHNFSGGSDVVFQILPGPSCWKAGDLNSEITSALHSSRPVPDPSVAVVHFSKRRPISTARTDSIREFHFEYAAMKFGTVHTHDRIFGFSPIKIPDKSKASCL